MGSGTNLRIKELTHQEDFALLFGESRDGIVQRLMQFLTHGYQLDPAESQFVIVN